MRAIYEVDVADRTTGAVHPVRVTALTREDARQAVIDQGEIAGEARLVEMVAESAQSNSQATPARPARSSSVYVTTQRTSKDIKASCCLAWVLILTGGPIALAGAVQKSVAQSAYQRGIEHWVMVGGMVFVGLGLLLGLSSAMFKWWHHD